VETETLSFTEDLCPKDIVTQLLEIAKAHDALDEIGGATSWRWQEGIISRMPKTKTVSKVLRKAYCSEDPIVWFQETEGSLRKFIKNNFLSGYRDYSDFEPADIYDTLFIILTRNTRGVSFEELVLNFSVLKFLKNNKNEDDYSFFMNQNTAVELYGAWATRKVSHLISLLGMEKNSDGFYSGNIHTQFVNEKIEIFKLEIQSLRFRVVGGGSKVDMFRSNFVDLSYEEMIDLEWMIIDFHKKFKSKIDKITSDRSRRKESLEPRIFSFIANTLPINGMGELS